MLAASITWLIVRGQNALENVWAPMLAAFGAVGIWESIAWLIRFCFTVPREMHFEAQDLQTKTSDHLNEALDRLSEAADIQGEIVVMVGWNPNQDQSCPGSTMRYDCECSNHGKTECEISQAFVSVTPQIGQSFGIPRKITPQKILPGGLFRFSETIIEPFVMPDVLRQSKIEVYLLDSLGVKYTKPKTRISPEILRMRDP